VASIDRDEEHIQYKVSKENNIKCMPGVYQVVETVISESDLVSVKAERSN